MSGVSDVDIGSFEVGINERDIAPSTPDLQAISDNGISSDDNVTSLQNLSFDVSGLTVGATVEFFRDGVLVGSSIATSSTVSFVDNNRPLNSLAVYFARQTIGGLKSIPSGGVTVAVDNTAPTVTMNQTAGQADPTRFQPISFTVTFSEPVSGFDSTDVLLNGSTAGVGSAQIQVSGGPQLFTVTVTGITTDGSVVASVPAGACLDRVLLSNSASTSTDNSITLDTTPPQVIINQASSQSDPTRLLPINYSVVFSESVSGFTGSDVSLLGSTANVAVATRSITGNGTSFNVAIGNVSSNGGFVIANIPTAAVQDAAGNTSIASTSTDNVVKVDNVRPNVTVNQAEGQSDPTSGQPIHFIATFTEPITGLEPSDISFTGSTVSTVGAIVTVTGVGVSYNIAISNLVPNGGFLRVNVPANSVSDSLGNLNIASTSSDNSVTLVPKSPFDFDGDGKTDVSVFRPSEGNWYILQSQSQRVRAQGWGLATDKLAPADFDGDGKTDLAVFRESDSNWYIFNSLTNTATVFGWGLAGDQPVPADYNGDQKADIAVYRPSESNWYRKDSDGQIHVYQWGIPGDKPAPADFNGDGVADMTVFRPSEGRWFTINSGDASISVGQWGLNGDIPIPADYSGDGRADFCVFRPSDQTWYRIHSDDNSIHVVTWGLPGDLPVPGDYDGDGRNDLAVFRPSNSTWYIFGSQSGIYAQPFGLTGDKPTPNAFVY